MKMSPPALLAEADRRIQADVSDFDLTCQLLNAANNVNSFNMLPVPVGNGLAYPIESGISTMPDSYDYELRGGSLVLKPTFEQSPKVAATYVGLWDRAKEAAVYMLEREIELPEDGGLTVPVGTIARSILEGGRHPAKVPDIEANIYSTYPTFGEINYELTDATEIAEVTFDSKDDSHWPEAVITMTGPLRILDAQYHRYYKVDGDRIWHSSEPETADELEVTFPEDVMTFRIQVPDECYKVTIYDGHVISLRSADSEGVLGLGLSLAELYEQAASAQSEAREPLLQAYGISVLEQPALSLKAHAAIGERLGWIENTEQFLDNRRAAIRDQVETETRDRIIGLGRRTILETLNDREHPTEAAVVGTMAVMGFLRDRLQQQRIADA